MSGGAGAASIDDRHDELVAAVAAAAESAERWRQSIARLSGEDERSLGLAAAERGLDRCAQVRAVLDVVDMASRTIGAVIGASVGRMRARRPDQPISTVAEDVDVELSDGAAAGVAVFLTGALSNVARHAAVGASAKVHARAGEGGSVLVAVEDHAPRRARGAVPAPVPGLGVALTRDVMARLGGEHRFEPGDHGLRVSIRVPAGVEKGSPGEATAAPTTTAADRVRPIDEIAALVQHTHGMAQPLREALWLMPSPESQALAAALRRLDEAGAAITAAAPASV